MLSVKPTKKHLIEQVEKLSSIDQMIEYQLHKDFSGAITVIQLNPLFGEKKQKKYLLGWKKRPDATLSHIFSSDKAKDVANWVHERLGYDE